MTLEVTRTAHVPATHDVPSPTAHLLQLAHRPLRALMQSWWDVHILDDVKIPTRGGVIIASNHVGTLDGPLVVAANARPVYSLCKAELFHGPVGWLLRKGGQLPIERETADVGAIRRAVKVLREGNVLAIYPEGARDAGDFSHIHPGVAYLALMTGAPVVPCAVLGTRLPGAGRTSVPPRGSRLDIVFGNPIAVAPQPWPRRRQDVEALRCFLSHRLQAHVADAQRRTGQILPGRVPVDLS